MIGDMLVIYNERTGKFFGGRDRKIFVNRKAPPIWKPTLRGVRLSSNLKALQGICAELGDGVRVISETRARQIVMLKARKEIDDVRRESEQGVLQ